MRLASPGDEMRSDVRVPLTQRPSGPLWFTGSPHMLLRTPASAQVLISSRGHCQVPLLEEAASWHLGDREAQR